MKKSEDEKETKEKKGTEKRENEEILREKKENIEEKISSEEQFKSENKILKGFFVFIGCLILIFLIGFLIINSTAHFEYKGVKFDVVKEGKLIFYKTSIPVKYNDPTTGKIISTNYNFYIRNDPRKLEEKVPIGGGNITFRKNMVLDLTTENLFCDGDWNLALHNSITLYRLLDLNLLVKNESAKYEPLNDYMFVTIQIGNSTNIDKVGENTYEINVNNCEILPALERLMIEAFVRYREVNS